MLCIAVIMALMALISKGEDIISGVPEYSYNLDNNHSDNHIRHSEKWINQEILAIPIGQFRISQRSLKLIGRVPDTPVTPHQGILFIKQEEEWNLICANHWDIHSATVACRQLGFPLGAMKAITESYYGNMKYIYSDVKCHGNETTLAVCAKTVLKEKSCNKLRVAGVLCRTVKKKCRSNEFQCSPGQCIRSSVLCDGEKDCTYGEDEDPVNCNTSLAVRLVNGSSAASGRVEIRYNGVWGTICDDWWNRKNAQVICRMLGYVSNWDQIQAHYKGYFGKGVGLIWLDNVKCTGKERSIEDCKKRPWGQHNCGHREDAGVTCLPDKNPGISISTSTTALPAVCGRKQIKQYPKEHLWWFQSSRIIGGHQSIPGSHPWHVAVYVRKNTGITFHCGAVVISEWHILSAAHCFDQYSASAYIIRLGDYDSQVQEKSEEEFEIENVIIHEDFNDGAYLNNDIALIKVKPKKGKGFRFGKYIQPVCLPSPDTDYSPGMSCVVSGWGRINKNTYAEKLQEVEVPILPWSVCRQPDVYGPLRFTENMICVGHLSGGFDACKGDSGGPLVCSLKDRFILYGLVSWGDGCGESNKPGVYVHVPNFLEWIKRKIMETQEVLPLS